jgi:Ca-activated chloride channel family protein
VVQPTDRPRRGRRHLASRPRRRPAAAIALAAALLAGGIAAAALVARGRPVRNLGCPPDVVAVTVLASPEMSVTLRRAAVDYARTNPTVAGRCVEVHVAEKPSGAAANSLAAGWDSDTDGPRPDVWVPSSAAWAGIVSARLLTQHQVDIIPQDHPSIANSPLVLAMPRPMAAALGWPRKPIGWSDLLTVLRPPLPGTPGSASPTAPSWAQLGHPEWGRFLVGRTDPNQSNPGLESLLAVFYLASARTGHGPLTAASLADGQVQAFALALERTPGPQAITPETLLTDLQRADDAGNALGFLSMAALDEKSVLDYNQGNPSGDPATLGRHPKPKVPLAAVYLTDGTLVADHPYLSLDAPWVDADQRQAAVGFLGYLRSGPVQAGFQAVGFRNFSGVAGDQATEATGVLAGQPATVLPPPAAPLIGGIVDGYNLARKTANLIGLLDVSGSMSEPAPGTGGKTKLDLEKAAAMHANQLFSGDDDMSVWAFATNLGGPNLDWRPLVGYGRLDGDVAAGVTRRQALAAAEANLRAGGNTGLYDSIAAADRFLRAHYTPGRINLVAVMTDGINDDPGGGITLPELLEQLKAGQDSRPVRVLSIGFGADVDSRPLQAIAKATDGAFFLARNLADVDQVFLAALANF